MKSRARHARSLVALATLGIALAAVEGCRSFGTTDVSTTATDGGQAADARESGDTGAAGHGILCGSGERCPPSSVCCFDADGGTESCTTKEACNAAPLDCTTTFDCIDAGAPAGSVCCVFDDHVKLVRTSCVQGSACDPSGPQDWVCDSALAPTMQCTDPDRPRCLSYAYPAPINFGVCGH